MEERCVFCGAIIPEGRQVCPNCENKYKGIEKGDQYADSKKGSNQTRKETKS